jgi:hypothetical protein
MERQQKAASVGRHGMGNGSRKLRLNDLLVSEVMFCETLEELLDIARTENMGLPEIGLEMLEDEVVVRITAVIWKHRRKVRGLEGPIGKHSDSR